MLFELQFRQLPSSTSEITCPPLIKHQRISFLYTFFSANRLSSIWPLPPTFLPKAITTVQRTIAQTYNLSQHPQCQTEITAQAAPAVAPHLPPEAAKATSSHSQSTKVKPPTLPNPNRHPFHHTNNPRRTQTTTTNLELQFPLPRHLPTTPPLHPHHPTRRILTQPLVRQQVHTPHQQPQTRAETPIHTPAQQRYLHPSRRHPKRQEARLALLYEQLLRQRQRCEKAFECIEEEYRFEILSPFLLLTHHHGF